MPKVSIIVPVYKAEKVLSRCVDSILAQSFKDWELILVDDGSPDGSGVLCDKYANTIKPSNHQTIRTIHKQNGGVSSARNIGLEHATGKYITFVDADDYIQPDFLEKMAAATPADLVVCGFKNIGPESFTPNDESLNLTEDCKAVEKLIDIPYYTDAPWCKFFRRQIIVDNNLQFDRGLRLSEDTLFCYKYLSHCKTVNTISCQLYVYDGVWGGDSKYQLSYQELLYASKRVVGALDRLNTVFGSHIETKHKCWHLSKLKGLFSEYTDKDSYELYIQTHSQISFEDFMADNQLSPLTIGILTANRLIRSGNITECRQHLTDLKKFITSTPQRYPSTKHKLFYTSLLNIGVMHTIWLMKFATK